MKVTLQKLSFKFLLDTGSAASIIDKSAFDKLGIDTSLLQKVLTTLTSAEGSQMKIYGKIPLKFKLGNKVYTHDFIVADLYNMTGLLGMDFFEQYEVNMQISNLTMTIEGYKIKLFKQPYDSCANVKISKLMVIPPDSDYTVKAYIKGNVEKKLTILEPYKSLQKRGLLVARSVYDASSEVVQINTINLTDETIILYKDTLVGRLEPVKSISSLNDIHIDSNLETNKNDNIPEHLKVMIEKASLELKNEEKLKVSKFDTYISRYFFRA